MKCRSKRSATVLSHTLGNRVLSTKKTYIYDSHDWVLTQSGVYHPSDITNAAIYAVGRIKDNPDLYSASLSWCNVGVGLWFELITGSSAGNSAGNSVTFLYIPVPIKKHGVKIENHAAAKKVR